MSTTVTKVKRAKVTVSPTFRTAYVPSTALANGVKFDADMMHVSLLDGRVVSVPILWFPILSKATPKQRKKVEIAGGGNSLHWPDIDEDLSVAGLLAGADLRSM